LGAVKTEFHKFGEVLAKTKKKLDEASSVIESAEQRTRVMGRRLKSVEALTEDRATALLAGDEASGEWVGDGVDRPIESAES
jgi:DNA recombination protein RmuC